MESKFDKLEVQYIPRKLNSNADTLANWAAERQHLPGDVLVEVITKPSIPMSKSGPNPMLDPSSDEAILTKFLGKCMLGDMAHVAALVRNGENWMDPIRAYLTNQATLVDDMNIERTNCKAMGYQMVDGTLYKRW